MIYQTTTIIYVGLPVSLTGIAASATSLVLFSRDSLTAQTTHRLLLTMSSVDIAFLLTSLLYLQTMSLCGRRCHHIAYILPVGTLVNIFEMLRNWIVVLICIERYMICCHPLQAKRWLGLSKTNACIVICVLFALISRAPFMFYVILEFYDIKFASSVKQLKTLHSTIDGVLVTLVPLLILVVCSLRISQSIHKSEKLRRKVVVALSKTTKNLPSRSNSTKVTRVLLIVIVVFAILMLPLIPVNIFSFNWFPSIYKCQIIIGERILNPLAALGSLLHSLTNFLIYVVYWQKYRRILMELCKGNLRRQQDNPRSSTSNANEFLLSRTSGNC